MMQTTSTSNLKAEEKRALLRALLAEQRAKPKQYPTSFSQQRLWFLDQLAPGNPFYNVEAAIPMSGVLDLVAFQQAINAIVARHESLRTTFSEVDGQPIQVVAPQLTIDLPIVDLRTLSPAARQAEQQRLRSARAQEPFDLAKGPLLRTEMVRLGDEEWLFLLNMHHIIADGWSMGVFSRELTEHYMATLYRRPPQLLELPIQYGDFARWQRQWLRGAVLEEQLTYWKKQLAGMRSLDLPTDRVRPPIQSYQGAFHTFSISEPLTAQIKHFSREVGVTLFMTLLAVFKVLLARYAGQSDIAIGTYIANRDRTEIEGLIGFFLNTLVLRTQVERRDTFHTVLSRVRESALGAYAHQAFPFEKLVEELQPARDLSRNPLIQIAFQLQNASVQSATNSREALIDYQRGAAIFDIAVTLYEGHGQLHAIFEYSTDLFDAATIEQMAGHYTHLLAVLTRDPEQEIGTAPLLTPDERQQILVAWNRTAVAHPLDKSIVELFDEQAQATPNAPCFFYEEQTLTYSVLQAYANQLAHQYRARGVMHGQIVGVLLPRSFDQVAAMLAVWKVGAIYLPLDPSYPVERLAYMLEDSQAALVVSRRDLLGELWASVATSLLLDQDVQEIASQPTSSPAIVIDAADLSHVLYTSGSTGRPKGVASPHRQILNRLWWMWRTYPFRPGEVSCHKTAISFIDSLWELLGPLLKGIPSVIAPTAVVLDPQAFVHLLNHYGVSRLWLVPSYLWVLLDQVTELRQQLPQLTFWVVSGEALSAELFAAFARAMPHAVLYNLYGTSEIWDATWYDPTGVQEMQGRVPIGRPIDNVQTYVLDDAHQPVPIGVAGELYVAGAGLCSSILNQPDLTRRRLAPLPFAEAGGQLAVACGDLVRYRRTGDLEFLGRLDNQVKVRGYRVEPSEIEGALLQHDRIQNAAVLAWPHSNGMTRLVAYLVAKSPIPTVEELRRFLARTLPDFMIPERFEVIDQMPLTPSGKSNREALRSRGVPRVGSEGDSIAPRNEAETAIAAIWATTLACNTIGVESNFFALGGHSLLATQVVARINKTFNVAVRLQEFFEAPTVAALAALVTRTKQSGEHATEPAPIPKLARERYRTVQSR